jgi:hypothetical protein
VHVQPLERRARLTGVDERAPEQALRDRAGVDVGKDDPRVVAAELQGQALHGVGRALDDGLAGGGGPREHELVDVRVAGQASAQRPVAGHGGQHVGGKRAVEDLHQREDAQRRVLGRLDDDGVAHPQGGATCQTVIIMGQFHGPIAPTTPTGR